MELSIVSQEQETRLGDIDLSELQRSGIVLVCHGERLRRAISIAAPRLRRSLETEDVALDHLEYGA
jgi:hypothetical protein